MKRLSPNDLCGCGSGKKVKKCCLVSIEYTPEEQKVIDLKRAEKEKWDLEDSQSASENLIAFESQLKQWETNHTKEKIPLTGEPFDRKTGSKKTKTKNFSSTWMEMAVFSMAAVGTPWKNPIK